jgi:hypothetical protein
VAAQSTRNPISLADESPMIQRLSQLNMVDLEQYDLFATADSSRRSSQCSARPENDSGIVSSKNSAMWTI